MTVRLSDFLAQVRPNHHDLDYTWATEAQRLWLEEPDYMCGLVRHLADGGEYEPVTIGDDGKLWDGHHRVVALMALGERFIRVQRYEDLDDEAQMASLLSAVEDAELRGAL